MRVLLVLFALAAACGTSSTCDLKSTSSPAACTGGTIVDTNAKTCQDAEGGAFICRNGAGYCVVCTGASFDDGCEPNSASGSMLYCVHDCSHC